MTYSILVRDPASGEIGVATQSQAFAVGSSVPWAMPGYGVIATQSMGEPMYGELGLDLLRSGLTAPEALVALRGVDPHPERRQVAMIDGQGDVAVYTGDACVPAAGHREGEQMVAMANLATSAAVWEAMVDACTGCEGPLAPRMMAALHAAEEAGGDLRGRRSTSSATCRWSTPPSTPTSPCGPVWSTRSPTRETRPDCACRPLLPPRKGQHPSWGSAPDPQPT